MLTGKAKKDKSPVPTYTEIFGRALVRLAKENPKIVGITAAMGSGTGIDKLQRELPERTYDVGIAEQHAVTFAAGMATEGTCRWWRSIRLFSSAATTKFSMMSVCRIFTWFWRLTAAVWSAPTADAPRRVRFRLYAFDPQYGDHGAQGRK